MFTLEAGWLLVDGGVPLVLGPCVAGHGPLAVGLDAEVVLALQEPEEPVLAPVGAPGVPADPVFNAVFDAPAHQADGVHELGFVALVDENAACVVSELGCYGHAASDGAALEDLVHHGFFALDLPEFVDAVNFGVVLGPAALSSHAISAFDVAGTFHSVCVAFGLIVAASFVGDVVFVDECEGVQRVAAFAALVVRAGD